MSNLRLTQAESALSATNGAYIDLKAEVRAALTKLEDVLVAMKSGHWIDAHEHLLDARADLRAALTES